MRILFVADPVEKLKPLGDSTLAMARQAVHRKHEVYWAIDSDFEISANRLNARPARIERFTAEGLPELGASQWMDPRHFDAVLIRKDPPFDAGYVRLCWLLGLVEHEVWMLNRPSILLRYHEKLVPLEALSRGFLKEDDLIPTFVGTPERARDFIRGLGTSQVISKPFLGFAGRDVSLFDVQSYLDGADSEPDLLVQPFHPEVVKEGDRRVFFLGGKVLAQFTRLPKAGGYISNLAQGGRAESSPLSQAQSAVLERLGGYLASVDIFLAGADLIGSRISEVNVTSPTGLRSLEALEGRDYSKEIIEYVERSAPSRKK